MPVRDSASRTNINRDSVNAFCRIADHFEPGPVFEFCVSGRFLGPEKKASSPDRFITVGLIIAPGIVVELGIVFSMYMERPARPLHRHIPPRHELLLLGDLDVDGLRLG